MVMMCGSSSQYLLMNNFKAVGSGTTNWFQGVRGIGSLSLINSLTVEHDTGGGSISM